MNISYRCGFFIINLIAIVWVYYIFNIIVVMFNIFERFSYIFLGRLFRNSVSELDFKTTRTDAFSLSLLNSSPILSFVSNDFNPFIFISLSKSGELLLNGVIIAANKITQTIILHH